METSFSQPYFSGSRGFTNVSHTSSSIIFTEVTERTAGIIPLSVSEGGTVPAFSTRKWPQLRNGDSMWLQSNGT